MKAASKIPGPPAKQLPLRDLTDSDLNAAPVRKKRGATSTLPGNAAKRAAADEPASWEAVASQAGWTGPEDALRHALRLKKNERNPQTVKSACLAYVQQLRALGWSLHSANERLEAECASLRTVTARAEAASAERDSLAAALRAELAGLEARLQLCAAEAEQHRAAARALEQQLEAAAARAAALQAQVDAEAAGARDARTALQRLEAQAASVAELHAQSQRYCAQLQEYNSNLQRDVQAAAAQLQTTAAQLQRLQEDKAQSAEAAAGLRGTLCARDAELAAAREAVAASAAARQAAMDEAAGGRAELDALRCELDKARAAAGGIDALSKDLLHSRLRECEVAALRERAETAEAGLAEALARCADAEEVRRAMHNTIMDLKGAIRVFVRVRPSPEDAAVRVCGGGALELATRPGRAATCFSFDHVFAPGAQQAEVFAEVAQLVQSALDGYRVCIFAYGSTGSGKTHTMIGGAGEERGVVPRALEKLYARAGELQQHHGWAITLKATCLEIFCDELVDLLGGGPPAGKKHTITHGAAGAEVAHLRAVPLDTAAPAQARALLAGAMERRAVAATACNERSSRSHLVFTIAVAASNARTGQTTTGLLNLVDLAGSERLSRSGATGDRLKETQAINRSLSSLGDVIAALGSKAEHVPYRNSKLTWLLQPCLSADAKALFFINISSDSSAAAQESLCSLRFGAKINATTIGVPRPCLVERPDSKQRS